MLSEAHKQARSLNFVTEWYGWAAYHPQISIFGRYAQRQCSVIEHRAQRLGPGRAGLRLARAPDLNCSTLARSLQHISRQVASAWRYSQTERADNSFELLFVEKVAFWQTVDPESIEHVHGRQ